MDQQETPQIPQTPTSIQPSSQPPRTEEFKLNGDQIFARIKDILHEGNVRRISLKDADGRIIAEFPLTAGVIGALLAPSLAAIGAIVALASDLTIVVERRE
ncbi:MAG: DUF4342 domain-containing protein [Chloroflexia bacterium]